MDIKITKDALQKDIADIFGCDTSEYHPPSYLESRLRDNMVFLAKNGNQPIGFLIYSIWWGNCPFIELIKVKEEYQRKGVGISLLKAAGKEIKTQNLKTLISSSETINQLGQDFHRKWGFKDLNTLKLPHGQEQFFSIDLEELL